MVILSWAYKTRLTNRNTPTLAGKRAITHVDNFINIFQLSLGSDETAYSQKNVASARNSHAVQTHPHNLHHRKLPRANNKLINWKEAVFCEIFTGKKNYKNYPISLDQHIDDFKNICSVHDMGVLIP